MPEISNLALLQLFWSIVITAVIGAASSIIFIWRLNVATRRDFNTSIETLKITINGAIAAEAQARETKAAELHGRISRLQEHHNSHVKEVARDYARRNDIDRVAERVDVLIGEVRKRNGQQG